MRKTNNRMIKIAGMLAFVMMALCAVALPGGEVSAKDVDISVDDYGYGKYVVKAHGTGFDGVADPYVVTFWYLPVTITTEQIEGTEEVEIDLDYDTSETGPVKYTEINVYDEDGDVVYTARVDAPAETTTLDFGALGLGSGTYRITATAYGADGEALYTPYETTIVFVANALAVPDTGEIAKAANISQADFLVTGLIIFGIVVVAGVTFILRGDKRKATAKVSARNAKSASSRAKTRRK